MRTRSPVLSLFPFPCCVCAQQLSLSSRVRVSPSEKETRFSRSTGKRVYGKGFPAQLLTRVRLSPDDGNEWTAGRSSDRKGSEKRNRKRILSGK